MDVRLFTSMSKSTKLPKGLHSWEEIDVEGAGVGLGAHVNYGKGLSKTRD